MWEYVCPECGSSLDPGEKCECEEEDPEFAENFRNALCKDELFEVAGEYISENKEERTE